MVPSGTEATKVIEVIDLHKSFDSVQVLKGISFTARQGDVIAIIGGSGSGKSTLLRCVNMLETPTSGSIKVHEEEIKMKSDGKGGLKPANKEQIRRIRTRLAMVFQSFNLWQHMTLLENVIEVPVHVLGKPKAEAEAMADALLKRVGLSDKRETYPAFLSGGQQQRAAIARALAIEPEVMLFDEPTSALDPELIGEVLSVIRDLAKEGRTMLLVTHEMKFAREVANRIIFLNNCVIEEEGDPESLFGAPESMNLKRFISSME
ncbi:MAG TPA: ATP-binding cassette domain-containing protein [Desulfotignum sp.]|nr:ATP-binding cassette domain-containing protein [Desulfotignum sp.]